MTPRGKRAKKPRKRTYPRYPIDTGLPGNVVGRIVAEALERIRSRVGKPEGKPNVPAGGWVRCPECRQPLPVVLDCVLLYDDSGIVESPEKEHHNVDNANNLTNGIRRRLDRTEQSVVAHGSGAGALEAATPSGVRDLPNHARKPYHGLGPVR